MGDGSIFQNVSRCQVSGRLQCRLCLHWSLSWPCFHRSIGRGWSCSTARAKPLPSHFTSSTHDPSTFYPLSLPRPEIHSPCTGLNHKMVSCRCRLHDRRVNFFRLNFLLQIFFPTFIFPQHNRQDWNQVKWPFALSCYCGAVCVFPLCPEGGHMTTVCSHATPTGHPPNSKVIALALTSDPSPRFGRHVFLHGSR